LLVDLGHEVSEASDAREALDRLRNDPAPFDLLVTDYAMPLISGTELIEQARQLRAELPALLITGYADAQSIARRPEDVAVIPKPFTSHQFGAALIAAVGSPRKADQAALPPLRAVS
jgi:CheY-like chemotaxis protein